MARSGDLCIYLIFLEKNKFVLVFLFYFCYFLQIRTEN